jgi:hypothetical protein
MKYFALLVVAVVASVEAGGIGIGHGVGVVGVVNTGASAVSRSDDVNICYHCYQISYL